MEQQLVPTGEHKLAISPYPPPGGIPIGQHDYLPMDPLPLKTSDWGLSIPMDGSDDTCPELAPAEDMPQRHCNHPLGFLFYTPVKTQLRYYLVPVARLPLAAPVFKRVFTLDQFRKLFNDNNSQSQTRDKLIQELAITGGTMSPGHIGKIAVDEGCILVFFSPMAGTEGEDMP